MSLAHTHACRLLECWAALPVPLTAGQVQAGHLVVDESLRSAAPDIQAAAVATLRALSRAYLPQLGLQVGLEPFSLRLHMFLWSVASVCIVWRQGETLGGVSSWSHWPQRCSAAPDGSAIPVWKVQGFPATARSAGHAVGACLTLEGSGGVAEQGWCRGWGCRVWGVGPGFRA